MSYTNCPPPISSPIEAGAKCLTHISYPKSCDNLVAFGVTTILILYHVIQVIMIPVSFEYQVSVHSSPSIQSAGPIFVFGLLLGVNSDYAQPITAQLTEVTCPVIGEAQPQLTPSKRQKTSPGQSPLLYIYLTHFLPPQTQQMVYNLLL